MLYSNSDWCKAQYPWFRDCGFHVRDRWIALHRPDNAPDCGCDNVSAADCARCRQSFLWINGSRPNVYRFSDGEPDSHEKCVRLQFSGLWAGYPCDRKLKSVCKRRKFDLAFLAPIILRRHKQNHHYYDTYERQVYGRSAQLIFRQNFGVGLGQTLKYW